MVKKLICVVTAIMLFAVGLLVGGWVTRESYYISELDKDGVTHGLVPFEDYALALADSYWRRLPRSSKYIPQEPYEVEYHFIGDYWLVRATIPPGPGEDAPIETSIRIRKSDGKVLEMRP